MYKFKYKHNLMN